MGFVQASPIAGKFLALSERTNSASERSLPSSSRQGYGTNSNAIYLYAQPPMVSPFSDPGSLYDAASVDSAVQRHQMNELRMQLMRQQLQQQRRSRAQA
jgi:hypothetical protein